MAPPYELEVTISSAKNLKNVNWRHGPLKPYAVVWVDPKYKHTTHVDEEGDESPVWNQTLTIPLPDPIDDSTTLYIDIVHAYAAEDTKPLIGSAKLKLKEVVDEVGIGQVFADSLQLKRPSGRPHGTLDVKIRIKEPGYRAPDPYYYPAPAPAPYAPAPYAGPPSGYPYPAYGAVPQYGQPVYGGGYREEGKKGGMGMGTGMAVGAAAGLLGGLALAEGVDYVEDQIAEDAAEKVEEDLGYDVGDE